MDNKRNLIEGCGPAAEALLEENAHVVILWDLIPRWVEAGKIYSSRMKWKRWRRLLKVPTST